VLMIGGGGFAWPKAALSSRPSLCVDVCEPEAAVTCAARAWFYLDELEELAGERLRIFETDGISHLTACDRLYDAIIDDAFSGFAAAEDLLSDEGLALIRSRLAPGGLFLANVVCDADATPLFELVGRMERTFAQVSVLITTDEALSDDDNYLIIASDANYRFEGALL
ncbi:MAG: fused MFS/spermidine synthase, partial [Atopobiaceae bacterium]|nr:fused MFS/spermidine synthase [Atopobiaceae bacterium]